MKRFRAGHPLNVRALYERLEWLEATLNVPKPEREHVTNHPGDVKRPLLAGILKDAGISREEFLRLL